MTDAEFQPAPDSAAPTATRSRWLVPTALGLATAALAGGLLLGRGMAAADTAAPLTDAVSVGFVRDMSVHHAQAVRMSEIAHRRSTDPTLTYMAFDILSTQQGQIGIMSGWLQMSGQTQSGSAPTMAWMGHSGPMPGMASNAEIEALDELPVAAMEEQWLRLMIRHHLGAVPMADVAARQADNADVALLAKSMSAGQQSEIQAMQDLLAARGLAPEPVPSPRDGSSATAEPGRGSAVSTPSTGHDGH